MEKGGPYKGQRSYKVAQPKRYPYIKKKRRSYINDSSLDNTAALDYYLRVVADGGTVEAPNCLQNALWELQGLG